MNRPVAKTSAIVGIIACILLLLLAGLRAIDWATFWICTALVAGFAYFILPKLKK